jgi:hypothetical protein
MKYIGITVILGGLLGCAAAPAPPEVVEEVAPPPAPRDESGRFPKEGLVRASVVEDHVLGRDFLPAGNVAEYERDGKAFTLFLINYESGDEAGLAAFDIKGHFADPKFVPHFGGFTGTEGGEPWFIFAKDKAIAGIVGLPLDEADQLARVFAGKMR